VLCFTVPVEFRLEDSQSSSKKPSPRKVCKQFIVHRVTVNAGDGGEGVSQPISKADIKEAALTACLKGGIQRIAKEAEGGACRICVEGTPLNVESFISDITHRKVKQHWQYGDNTTRVARA
jgi:hypothetical protein